MSRQVAIQIAFRGCLFVMSMKQEPVQFTNVVEYRYSFINSFCVNDGLGECLVYNIHFFYALVCSFIQHAYRTS